MRMIHAIAALSVAAGVSACVGSARPDLGGAMKAAEMPANAVTCPESGWRLAERVPPVYPPDLAMFNFMRQSAADTRALQYRFDIDETGSTANIRFVEPRDFLDHAATRQAIRAGADAIARWRYEAEGEEPFATGCRTQFNFEYRDEP